LDGAKTPALDAFAPDVASALGDALLTPFPLSLAHLVRRRTLLVRAVA